MTDQLAPKVRSMLEQAWHPPGFCVPNARTYPYQWLWDSCFHAVVWSALDDERAAVELGNVLANQDLSTGFVPHLTYWGDPGVHQDFWGRPLLSTITQPPMYGHVARVLATAGRPLVQPTLDRIERALRHLLVDRERTTSGLVPVLHPWETGCDDSPRWDTFHRDGETWRTTKGELVAALRPPGATPRRSDRFTVGSVGFNALLVWNTIEYLSALDDAGLPPPEDLGVEAERLRSVIAGRWDPSRSTWLDDGPPSGAARTLDGLLPLLVDPRPAGFAQLHDPAAFGAPYGPRGVHRAEAAYRPDVYWRGPAWPQLSYLVWLASVQAGDDRGAAELARALVDGAQRSGFAEYWHPDTGEGLGAVPQTWAGLALVVAGVEV